MDHAVAVFKTTCNLEIITREKRKVVGQPATFSVILPCYLFTSAMSAWICCDEVALMGAVKRARCGSRA